MSRGTIDLRERWEFVHDELRRLILAGELRPGERIREVELAEHFRVSRGPVREAIRELEGEGLAVRIQRRGSFITPLYPHDIEEIYSLRAAIEELAVRRAMARADPVLLFNLERSVAGMRRAIEDGRPDESFDPDLAFHSAFYEAADHGRLLGVWGSLRGPTRILFTLTAGRPDTEFRRTLVDHEALVDAVRDGDVERCISLMRGHLASALSMVTRYLVDPVPPIVTARVAGEGKGGIG